MDITNTEMLIVDKTTKEAVNFDGYFVYHPDRPKLRKDFFFMFQKTLVDIAKADLTITEMKVFMVLLSKLDFDNYIGISQKEVAEVIEVDKSHVSRAFGRLCDKEIITKFKKGNITAYKLSPSYGWKGNIKDHDAAIIDLDYQRTARKKSKIQQEQSAPLV